MVKGDIRRYAGAAVSARLEAEGGSRRQFIPIIMSEFYSQFGLPAHDPIYGRLERGEYKESVDAHSQYFETVYNLSSVGDFLKEIESDGSKIEADVKKLLADYNDRKIMDLSKAKDKRTQAVVNILANEKAKYFELVSSRFIIGALNRSNVAMAKSLEEKVESK